MLPGCEPGPPRWGTSDYTLELGHGLSKSLNNTLWSKHVNTDIYRILFEKHWNINWILLCILYYYIYNFLIRKYKHSDLYHCWTPGRYHVPLCVIRWRRSSTGIGFSLNFSRFSLLIIIPPLSNIHISSPSDICYSHDHAAQYHTFRH
jgi:hypothetical protein